MKLSTMLYVVVGLLGVAALFAITHSYGAGSCTGVSYSEYPSDENFYDI